MDPQVNVEYAVVGSLECCRYPGKTVRLLGCFSCIYLFYVNCQILQACRLSELLVKLRYSGLSVRVFGYRTSAQVDLDSFLEFVTASKMEVCLLLVLDNSQSV